MNKDGFIKDDKVWRAMKKNLLKGQTLAVKVGFFEDSVYGSENDNLPVAQVAQWQEEGTESIPMRPFIRAGFMIKEIEKHKWINAQVIQWIDAVARGRMSWTQLYNHLGPVFVKMMQKEIENWRIPMNAPLTVELKGFNDPLIDTGKMMDSVNYRLGRKTD
jgi:hypothetical protein